MKEVEFKKSYTDGMDIVWTGPFPLLKMAEHRLPRVCGAYVIRVPWPVEREDGIDTNGVLLIDGTVDVFTRLEAFIASALGTTSSHPAGVVFRESYLDLEARLADLVVEYARFSDYLSVPEDDEHEYFADYLTNLYRADFGQEPPLNGQVQD